MAENFEIQMGSDASEPFAVVFSVDAHRMTASCSCSPHDVGIHCKHQLDILLVVLGAMQDEVADEIYRLQTMRRCTDLAERTIHLRNMARAMNASRRRRRRMQYALARATGSDARS